MWGDQPLPINHLPHGGCTPHQGQGSSWFLHLVGALSGIVSQSEWVGHTEIANSSMVEDSDRGEKANSRSQPRLPLSLLSNCMYSCSSCERATMGNSETASGKKNTGRFSVCRGQECLGTQQAEGAAAWYGPHLLGKAHIVVLVRRDACIPERNDAWRS